MTRCPALDESFPFMLPGWRAEKTPGGFIMIHLGWRRIVVGRKMATDPRGGGGGFAAGSVVRFDPRIPGGGGAGRIAAPRGVVGMEIVER